LSKHHLIKIKDWIFDPSTKSLLKDDGSDESVTLENKQCLLLQFLIENHSQVVNRDQLIETVWFGRIVEELTINAVVSRLRKVLGGEKNEYIKTHPKIGYSLVCEVKFIEKEIEEPEIIKLSLPEIQPLKSKIINNTHVLLTFVLSLTVIIASFFIAGTTKESINTTVIEKSSSSTPLTYIEGWELNAELSPDKRFLAFTHKDDANSKMQVMIKDIKTNKTITVSTDKYSTSPSWSPDGSYLYYQTFDGESCQIEKTAFSNQLKLLKTTLVASCGNILSMSPISTTDTWVYFSYKKNDKTPYVIRRKNLNSENIENLTISTAKFYGDYSLNLSPDGKKIAFLRMLSGSKIDLMYLDLTTGEIKVLSEFNHIIYKVDWNSDSNLIVFIDGRNFISSISIKTLEIKKIHQSNERLSSPSLISRDEILVSKGEFYKSNIKKINLNDPEIVSRQAISSSFNDYDATSSTFENNEYTAFISDRSGYNQIWLLNKNELIQLTSFSDSKSISEIQFSYEAKNLLFIRNNQLFTLNIKSKLIKELTPPHEIIKNPIWLCSNNNEILTTFHNQGSWDLYKIDIESKTKSKLLSSINSIKNDCSTNSYYVNTFKGINKLNHEWEITENTLSTKKRLFTEYFEWDVSSNYLYYFHEGHIYKKDILNNSKTELLTNEVLTNGFSISNNKLFYNQKTNNNTYISKIKLNSNL